MKIAVEEMQDLIEAYLEEHPGRRPSDIARALNVSPSTVRRWIVGECHYVNENHFTAAERLMGVSSITANSAGIPSRQQMLRRTHSAMREMPDEHLHHLLVVAQGLLALRSKEENARRRQTTAGP